jgi:hypothetical protein
MQTSCLCGLSCSCSFIAKFYGFEEKPFQHAFLFELWEKTRFSSHYPNLSPTPSYLAIGNIIDISPLFPELNPKVLPKRKMPYIIYYCYRHYINVVIVIILLTIFPVITVSSVITVIYFRSKRYAFYCLFLCREQANYVIPYFWQEKCPNLLKLHYWHYCYICHYSYILPYEKYAFNHFVYFCDVYKSIALFLISGVKNDPFPELLLID